MESECKLFEMMSAGAILCIEEAFMLKKKKRSLYASVLLKQININLGKNKDGR